MTNTTDAIVEAMARAAYITRADARDFIAAVLPLLREDIVGEGREREVDGEWDDFNAGWNSAVSDIRARFDAMAKELEQ